MVDLRASNDKLRDRAARIVSELTGLDRNAAFEALERAGGSVKAAAVMHRCSCELGEANDRLARHGGDLRGAMG